MTADADIAATTIQVTVVEPLYGRTVHMEINCSTTVGVQLTRYFPMDYYSMGSVPGWTTGL